MGKGARAGFHEELARFDFRNRNRTHTLGTVVLKASGVVAKLLKRVNGKRLEVVAITTHPAS